jgi:DNA-binding PadR family transcriptional regulator
MSDKYAILGVLRYEDLYGYEISKRIRTVEGFWYISPGNLYKALNSLLREKMVEIKRKEEHDGKIRKIYGITQKGKEGLEKWLSKPGTMPKVRHEPFLKIWFSLKEPENVIVQLRAIEKNAAELVDFVGKQDISSAPEYIKWMMEAGRQHAELDLKWSQSCLRKVSGETTAKKGK